MTSTFAPCPIERITGVWKFHRPSLRVSEARSLPGHLVHFIASGGYELTVSGRTRDVSAGMVIYYHDSENVLWRGKRSAVTFYSVGFLADIMPPPPERRIMSLPSLKRDFASLYRHSLLPEGNERIFLLYAGLSRILAGIARGNAHTVIARDNEWWAVENRIRGEKRYRMSVPEILGHYAKSYATLNRACRKATGRSIAKRLRELCLEEAKGLLAYSALSVTEIADHLGYSGIHEFSRDFKRHCGVPPTRYASGAVKRRFSS
ncbi:MAG: AraC family transcriptional regulator [Spirochaetota bacterium]